MRDLFPGEAGSPTSLGEIVAASDNPNNQGLSPGLMTVSPRRRTKAEKLWQETVAGIDLKKCGPLGSHDCMELLSRVLEGTFRNFQLHTRRPSHIDPPFTGTMIDARPATRTVAIPAGGAFTNVVSFTCKPGAFRSEIVALGHALENAAAFDEITWRVTIGTGAVGSRAVVAPYDAIITKIWDFVPPTPLPVPIHIVGGGQINIEASNAGAAGHLALARIFGWEYRVRSEQGPTVRSTIVD